VHDLVAKQTININFIPTEAQAADILTKALNAVKHQPAVQLLNLENPWRANSHFPFQKRYAIFNF